MSLATGLIPSILVVFELIVSFGVVGAKVTSVSQVDWERLDEIWQLSGASHVVRADRRLVHSGDDAAATRRANAGRCKRVCVANALAGQLVNGWSDRVRIAVAAEMGANVFGGKPQDVWLVGSNRLANGDNITCCQQES